MQQVMVQAFPNHFFPRFFSFLYRWKISIFLLLVLSILCLYPLSFPALPNFSYFDKFMHLSFYAVIGIGAIIDYFLTWNTKIPIGKFNKLALCLIIFGVTIEILQAFSGYRQGEFSDIVANSLGVFLVWLFVKFF
jgi:VanZ family protein